MSSIPYDIVAESFDDEKVIDVDNEKVKEDVKISKRTSRILKMMGIEPKGKMNNIAILGAGGVGKSYTVNELHSALTEKYGMVSYLTATTGVAALSLGGCTLHRWAGCGLAQGTAQQLAKEIQFDANKLAKWIQSSVLIIDEVSMLSDELFTKFEEVARIVRRNDMPFGGIRVIPVGDFLQLPPVKGKFAFQCDAWDRCNFTKLELTTPYRFTDTSYHELLHRARFGRLTEADHNLIASRVEAFITSASKFEKKKIEMRTMASKLDEEELAKMVYILPTMLYSTRKAVHLENDYELDQLQTKAVIYEAKDYALTSLNTRVEGHNAVEAFKLALEDVSPENLVLKVGAQVMHTINRPDGVLVNGSRGVIVALKKSHVMIKFDHGVEEVRSHKWTLKKDKITVVREQLPLILAWSTTIHKSQSATLSAAIADMSALFLPGMGYVILSRVRNLESLFLTKYDRRGVRAHPDAVRFHEG